MKHLRLESLFSQRLRADDLKERNKVTEIELKQVLIEFRKVS